MNRRISEEVKFTSFSGSGSNSPTVKNSSSSHHTLSRASSMNIKVENKIDGKSPTKLSTFCTKQKELYDKSVMENKKDRKAMEGLLKDLKGIMKDENESTKQVEKDIDNDVEEITKNLDRKYNQVKPGDKDLLNMVMFNQNEKKNLINQFNKDRMSFITVKGSGFEYAHKKVLRKKDEI